MGGFLATTLLTDALLLRPDPRPELLTLAGRDRFPTIRSLAISSSSVQVCWIRSRSVIALWSFLTGPNRVVIRSIAELVKASREVSCSSAGRSVGTWKDEANVKGTLGYVSMCSRRSLSAASHRCSPSMNFAKFSRCSTSWVARVTSVLSEFSSMSTEGSSAEGGNAVTSSQSKKKSRITRPSSSSGGR